MKKWNGRTPAAVFGFIVVVAAAVITSCSGTSDVDMSKLRVFFSSDALGYLEPCG
ncbi:MAG: hypothetical protein ACKVU1_17845 [bacterium]